MTREHGPRTPPEERPLVCAFNEMDMDERWLNLPPLRHREMVTPSNGLLSCIPDRKNGG